MKSSTLVTLGVVFVLVVAGWLVYRSTKPSEVLAPTPEPTTPASGSSTSQFIQQQPETSPVVDEEGVPLGSPTGSPSASTTPQEKVTIAISDTGFTPSTVTVKAGTTVTFVNNGQANHWPASDPHPVHTGLAGFDAKKGLATGESYSYTFTQPGTWGFHDHLQASLRGSVVVQ